MAGSSDTYGEKIEPHRVKVKLSRHRPEQAVRAQEFEAPRISRQLARECGKVVWPISWPPLLPGYIPGTHFC